MTDPQWDDGTALKLHDARRLTIGAWEALKASKDKLVDAILPTGILQKTNLIECLQFVSVCRWNHSRQALIVS